MLQKGFLESQKNTQENKKSRGYLMLGGAISFALGVITIMLEKYQYVGLGLIGVGSVLMCIGLWMNAMAQNKVQKQRRRRR